MEVENGGASQLRRAQVRAGAFWCARCDCETSALRGAAHTTACVAFIKSCFNRPAPPYQTPLLAPVERPSSTSALTTVVGDVAAAADAGAGKASGEQGQQRSVLLSVCSFVLLTEFCERLSYYGLAGSLVLLFQSRLGLSNSEVSSFFSCIHPSIEVDAKVKRRKSGCKATHSFHVHTNRLTTSTRCGPASATARP